MRPESIRQFEYFYLGSIALAVINLALAATETATTFTSMSGLPNMAEPGAQTGLGLALIGFGLLALLFAAIIPITLWYLAARKASEVARWLIVGLGVLSALRLLFLIVMLGFLIVTHAPTPGIIWWTLMIGIVSETLHMAAIAFLFPADAREWFARRGIGIREHEEIFS